MGMKVTTRSGGDVYPSPFLGPVDHTLAIDVPIAGLTADEIDARGFIKPGVPISTAGGLIGALTRSTPGAAVADGGNTGAATVGSFVGGYGAPTEVITITALTTGATGTFRVEGSVSGFLGTGAVGTSFDSPVISFLITDGTPDLTAGDLYTIDVVGGVSSRLFGCVVEPEQVATGNTSDERTAAGTLPIVVAVEGTVVRDALEEILGRALTASEVAAFADSRLTLSPTL